MSVSALESICNATAKGNYKDIINLVNKAIDEGKNLNKIINEGLSTAMADVGDKFASGELFLPDLVCASKVLKKALEEKGKVIIGIVFRDIHSIGKDMVSTLRYTEGFNIIDLGINVKSETFLNTVKENNPDILAMSALFTTTTIKQKKLIKGLKTENLKDKIIVILGGSPITQEFTDSIETDGYRATTPEGVKIIKELLNLK